ncbi:MAG: PAS domain-containing protein [Candidatus Brocadiales bacterium]|nr:PAS domain-containing protein [Candidatus Brocadiales bacterium]
MKFATKLTFIVTGIVLVVGFVASYFVYIANVNVLEKQIIGGYKKESIDTIGELDKMLSEKAADIRALAKSPVFTHACFTEKDITDQLIEYRNSYKSYITVSFCDMNRTKLADTYGLDIGKQQRLSPCWEEILNGKDSAMDVHVSETLQAPVMCLMQVVKNPEGQKVGVVNAKISINKLNDILGELNPDEHNRHIQFDLVNSEGLLVYSSYNRKGVLKDKPADVEVVNNHLAGKEHCFVSRYAGEKFFYVVTPERGFLDFKGNNWALIVRIPLKIALQPAVELRNKMMVISAVFGILLIPILMVLARLTARPIVRLRDAALEIGKGNFEIKLETASKDEVGQLYACFNTMTAGLKESHDRLMNYGKELEARVSERTQEIYLLQSLAIAVSASGNLHDALVVAIQKICNYTGWIYGEAWMPNQGGTRLERNHAFYSSIEGMEKFSEYSCGFTFTHGSGLPGRAWVEKQPVWIEDVTHDPHYLRTAIAGEVGFRTGIVLPVIADNEVVSVFVFYSLKAEERNDHLVKLILSMLSQIGSIIRRKQAEESLRSSEANLANAQRIAHMGSWVWNVGKNEVWWSEETYRIFGVESKEFIPTFEKGLTTVHPDDREFVQSSVHKTIYEGIPYDIEFRIIRPDGSERVLHSQGEVTYDTDGKPAQMSGTVLDVTERKRLEDALRRNEEQFRQLAEYIPECFWTITPDGHEIIYVSPAYEKIWGRTCKSLYENPTDWIKAVHPDDQMRIQASFLELMKHGNFDEVYRIVRPDGTIRWVYDRAFPIKDTSGNICRVVGIAEDITERKRIEDQLRKLSSVVEQSSTTIVITDTYGNIQYINPKFTQLTGYTLEEAVGKNPRILKSGKTPHEVYKQLWDAITAGGEWQGEFCNKKKNGEFYWELAHISPLRNSEGAITNFIAFKDDITERKQIEAEQEKLREQLFRSQNLASVGKLAGGVAHNFNNLLTVIMGYASLLNMEIEGNNPFKDYTQKIIKTSQTAADLTQALLAFSRKQPITQKPVNINEIIRQSESLLSQLIREDITLTTILSRENAIVMADVGQIEQVLMNLVTNARDAMPNGGNLTIHTDIMEMDDAFINLHGYGIMGKYVYIAVTDTGTGMDENTKLRVFEPFFTTKEVGRGTGLGLSSVYGIVKQHSGYIHVDSEPGKGATFNIYLPVIELEAEREEGEEAKIHAPLPKGGADTVLLAEDDAVVRELIRMVFERADYRVIEAVDGEDALVKFTEHKDSVKLLVSDLIMPKKNGKEVYEAIRKVAPDMKVLFITGYDDDVISKIDIQKEKFDYIIKPVLPVELLEKVREVLGKSRS